MPEALMQFHIGRLKFKNKYVNNTKKIEALAYNATTCHCITTRYQSVIREVLQPFEHLRGPRDYISKSQKVAFLFLKFENKPNTLKLKKNLIYKLSIAYFCSLQVHALCYSL